MPNIISVLQNWSATKSDEQAFLFLEDGENETDRISYGELDKRAKAVAGYLLDKNMSGQRVLLLYPAGIDFIVGFIGCLYAGAIAVPVACPLLNDFDKSAALLQMIALDADIKGIFTHKDLLNKVKESISQWMPDKKIFAIDINTIKKKKANKLPEISPKTIAYLQYTSGSTSTPKAAIVNHENLIHSLKYSAKVWKYTKNSITLTWAPHTHVYGLVCGLLLPLYYGTPSILMPVNVFIRRPVLWLQAITKYHVTHSGCPNFGYIRCVTNIDESEMVKLNLKSWKVAINGGENVQYDTLIQFCEKFGPYGFNLKQFNSAFGMSEVSGAIAVSRYGHEPVCFFLDKEALQHSQMQFATTGSKQIFVGNGRLLPGLEAVIVDPATFLALEEGEIGEIWLAGKSVVSGYWRRQKETEAIFHAQLAGSSKKYFRTGDLGFIYKNEICLTGRLKEIIVVHGKKYYPLDIETTIAAALNSIGINDCRAVFSIPVANHEEVILVQEVDEEITHHEKIIATIRHAITMHYGIDIYAVILVKKNTIPKTASGKLQRKLCQKQYLENKLQVIGKYIKNQIIDASDTKRFDKDQDNFGRLVASVLNINLDKLDYKAPLSKYAFDSINIIHLTTLLNEVYGLTLSPATLYEYQTLNDFYSAIIVDKQTEKKLKTNVMADINTSDIAIIGISGIFPGAPDVDTFWKNLIQGKNSISEIPANRWDWNEYYGDPHTETYKTNIKWGGFIEDIDCFDADFFNISPREAELTDPQQRLFLQVVWKVIEDAGYSAATIASQKTGLYVGVFNHDYAELLQKNGVIDAYMTTGTTHSILANRVSYLLNLRGPSEAIDTACSSSLVAIHHAIRAIQNGDCEIAIAGGVNALLTPTSFITASKAGMLCDDGRCKTFDKNANGFVRGEGIAAILLKKLDKALSDNDHIYGVIKGTAINHGGHVNSLTVPNPNAQADVIVAAHMQAKIPIDSIQYVETHGTGTALGDPIEVNGLKKAFHRLAEQQGKTLPMHFCGLGAVKTNIGHLESAAGIAGLIKILLAIKYELFPPNLNFDELNPYIDMAASPFYLINEMKHWKQSRNTTRRAGVSSFGFGGTNAHILIEEPPYREITQIDNEDNYYLITLSAKTDSALKQRMSDLHAWLLKQQTLPSLSALSYTLNAGRTHFDKRGVIVVVSIVELQNTLVQILQGRMVDNYINNLEQTDSEKNVSNQNANENDNLSIRKYRKSFIELGKKYVNGYDLDWEQIQNSKNRISLPTYPFAKAKYWIPAQHPAIRTRLPEQASLHALLDANVSTLESQAFSKLITGKERYLQDHKVNNDSILPGTAYIEMARAAVKFSLPNRKITSLRDIEWKKALKYDNPKQLKINLYPEDTYISFTVIDDESSLYAKGKLIHSAAPTSIVNLPSIDLAALKQNLTKQYSQTDLYSEFATVGLHYGKSFQVIQHAIYNDSEVLASIKSPKESDPSKKEESNISLLDGALHAAMILLIDKSSLYLPHSIRQFDIYGELSAICYAYVKLLSGPEAPAFHIQLSDENGKIILEIMDFIVRESNVKQQNGLYCYRPVWKQANIAVHEKEHISTSKSIMVFDNDDFEFIRQQLPHSRIISVKSGKEFAVLSENEYCINTNHPTDYVSLFENMNKMSSLPGWIIYRTHSHSSEKMTETEIHDQLQQSFYALYHLSKALLQQKPDHPIQILVVQEKIYHKATSLFVQALAGFAKTMQDENPNLVCRVIELQSLDEIISELSAQELEVRYDQQNNRLIKKYQEIPLIQSSNASEHIKQKGVYMLTGGMGGLGLIFARYLAQHYQAKLILTGRSKLDSQKQSIIQELTQAGAEVIYCQADVANKRDMQTLMQTIKKKFAGINGIIHAAGLSQDAFIINKTTQEAATVLAPKVYGTIYLDEITQSESLDFFVMFSSVASIFGNAGQCDYSYANNFMDCFANQREMLRKEGRRNGKTVSINWPLWRDGGIKIEEASIQWLENTLGIIPLTTDAGISMFQHALDMDETQVIVLPGQKQKLEQALLSKGVGYERIVSSHTPVIAAMANDEFRQQTIDYLKKLLSTAIKVSPEKIKEQAAFETYGIDSLMVIQLNQQLEKVFHGLPKTLFFEYQTLGALTDYFLKNHFNTLEMLINSQNNTSYVNTSHVMPAFASTTHHGNSKNRLHKSQLANDIAIVGLSGLYPKANNIDEFWHNLKTGRDCISEIPAERWDQNIYFATDKDNPGKSYSKWGGFIEDVDKFDPLFFNISPREAELMDPQERLFLQTAYSTLEDAGYTREYLTGSKTGVFVGVMYGQYQLFAAEESLRGNVAPTNSLFSSIANRVSYYFDFHGPSIALDTMCSSSLTSLHLACQSIRDGECDMALAGGVNVSIHPNKYLLLSQGKFLSTDGRCRSFGEGGDGYVPGEGVGAVLLKPLQQAIADGDHIYGVIKGSSINHGGKTNGYTVPNPVAQAAVIAQAYENANLDPCTVSYLEAHGTGTLLGDPIEIAALGKVFQRNDTPYFIGSVKSNIGHCESAAGIAAVTKILMQMKYQYIVPSLHANILNGNIDWSTNVFKVQQDLCEWKRPIIHESGDRRECFRIAGISSFGAGGSNAHIIIEEAPEINKLQKMTGKPSYLLVLSAKTDIALKQKLEDLYQWLNNHENELSIDFSIENVSFTLNTCRSHFDNRCAIVADSMSELMLTLRELKAEQEPENAFLNTTGKVKNQNQSIIKKMFNQLIHDLTHISRFTLREYREHLCALANFYVDGYELDLVKLHQGETNRKISLPTYPFAKERYWYNATTPISQTTFIANANAESTLLEQVMHNLTSIVSEQLKIRMQEINSKRNLSEYGMDSIHFVKLANHIEAYYDISFTPALFYTHNSVTAISTHLLNEFSEAISRAHHYQNTSVIQTNSRRVDVIHSPISSANHDIAIIGMQGLFPQSQDLQTFWEHLESGHDLVTEIPADRWDWRKYYGDAKANPDKSNSKWGAFIAGMDTFDASFFNISTREANLMDPQQRLFLEVVWKTIEDAGYDPATFSQQKIGVFAGVEFSEYHVLIANQHKEFHGYIATGNSHSMLANRVSYFFNLQGPSESIDTACSSSLVAIHRAVSAIRNGECKLAIAGGVSLILNPDTYVVTSQLGALSPDGRCKTFDKSANGYVKGEGVAAVLLKPLSQAKVDGDYIYGVIKGTAVNHGGKAQSLTAPNAVAQSKLLVDAYSGTDIDPSTLTYIEVHGTGTELGDPVEIEGLKLAFKQLLPQQQKQASIGLGSIKTNIGHLEPASGMAGVFKVLLAMQHGKLPGNVHLQELNPYINLKDSPFYVLTDTQSWKKIKDEVGREIPYRAGISSFGFGGTNAHIVIEQGSMQQQHTQSSPYYFLTLSAKQADSLKQKIADLYAWVKCNPSVNLHSLCFTLNTGRARFDKRCALIIDSVEHLLTSLQALIQGLQIDTCIMNIGQTTNATGPVFDEIYKSAIANLKNSTHGFNYRDALMILGDLYCKNYSVNWDEIYTEGQNVRVTSLPAYPFIKQRYWFDMEKQTSATSALQINKIPTTDLNNFTLQYLQTIFANKLQIAAEQIAFDETYEVYGVDSITGLEITERLENDFGTLSKTLLYERNKLQDLSAYFIKNYSHILQSLQGQTDDPVRVVDEPRSKDTEVDYGINSTPEVSDKLGENDIAIIGLSGIFPMAKDINEFWHNLVTARDCIGEVPPERWNYKDYPVMVGGKEKYFQYGGFIPDVDKFDPLFFNISPRDATIMDPQERLFLQSVWTTLEDAGYTREKLQRIANNEVGVFAGVTYNYYPLLIAEGWEEGNQLPIDLQTFSVANRVSYFLNLSGPSFVIDTACSSSLAAIHLACESILRGECKMAIAGGVNLSLHPSKFHFLGSFSFMSDQGRCTSFAEGGTGYVPSEGLGTVLLKPLSSAIRDNDRIYGVIKGSTMNHGGKTSGYTVPNPNSQAMVIKKTLEKVKINPRSISYIEAHGTGTALGDPIEIRGLQDAFEEFTQDKQFCAIGSVKSNIGHLESAAGISQLAKVLLQLRYKKLVPTLHTEKLNPFINFSETPFYVQRELSDWRTENGVPRRAGVSSFGAGGTNVHLIVEEYNSPRRDKEQELNKDYIFVLSAMNAERLQEYTKSVYDYLLNEVKQHDADVDTWLSDVCYTTQLGRESMQTRLVIVASSYNDLINKLKACVEQPKPELKGVWINHSVQASRNNKDMTQLIEQRDVERLADLWINGVKIPWAELYSNHKPNIVYLPTYPFAKRRCWAVKPTTHGQSHGSGDKPLLSVVPNEENTHPHHSNVMPGESKWLIFSDKDTGFLLQEELGKQSCLYCFTGNKYEHISNNVVYIDPDGLENYAKLFNSILVDQHIDLKGIIYLWTLEDVDHAQINQRFLYLFQTLIQQKWRKKIQFCLVTRSKQALSDVDTAEILQHHLWNLASYFNAEQKSHLISLISLAEKKLLREQAKCIAYEVQHMVDNQNHICYVLNERQVKPLVNPDRFIEYADQHKPKSELKFKSDISLDKESITTLVMNKLASILGLEVAEIDPEVAYLNYGMDSIIGINFVAELNTHFPDLLSPMDLYRYPNVSQLVMHILNSCKQEVADENVDVADDNNSMQTESEFMAEIAHLDNAQVSQLLEAELMELDEFFDRQNG